MMTILLFENHKSGTWFGGCGSFFGEELIDIMMVSTPVDAKLTDVTRVTVVTFDHFECWLRRFRLFGPCKVYTCSRFAAKRYTSDQILTIYWTERFTCRVPISSLSTYNLHLRKKIHKKYKL